MKISMTEGTFVAPADLPAEIELFLAGMAGFHDSALLRTDAQPKKYYRKDARNARESKPMTSIVFLRDLCANAV